jgi:hypothetical protein
LRGNMRALIASTAIATILAVGLAPNAETAEGDSYPNGVVREYDSISVGSNTDPGTLYLSTSSAVFSGLKGHMDLQFVGVASNSGDEEISEARIYRVVNADRFYRDNKWPNGLCDRQIEFIGMRLLPDLPASFGYPKGAIGVTALTQKNFNRITPSSVCTGISYLLNHAPKGKQNLRYPATRDGSVL